MGSAGTGGMSERTPRAHRPDSAPQARRRARRLSGRRARAVLAIALTAIVGLGLFYEASAADIDLVADSADLAASAPPSPSVMPSASAVSSVAAAVSPSSAPSAAASAPSPGTSLVPSTPAVAGAASPTTNVYGHDGVGMFSPLVTGDPERVYVPDEATGTLFVIDPRTYRIVARYHVGRSPEHVTPDWGLRRLYVEVAFSDRLTIIDPGTARPVGYRTVPGPYNLYFTPDGSKAILILDSSIGGTHQVSFYDRRTWHLIKRLAIPWPGADHLDFSADGRYALLSTEYSGFVVKVDVVRMRVVTALYVGGLPIDVKLAPDGRSFYVANQGRGGVSVIDPVHMREIAFIRTGRGAHGLAVSRDARQLYVTNRLAGTLSVIDFRTRRVSATWRIGESPDMIAVSPDGTQLWISNRFNGTVSVINARTGHRIALIRTGGRPHGLAFFPEPGRYSLGHNGVFR